MMHHGPVSGFRAVRGRFSPVLHRVGFLLLAALVLGPSVSAAQENGAEKNATEKKEAVHAKTLAELGGSLRLDPETGAGEGLVIDNEKLKELGAGVHLSQGTMRVDEAPEGESSGSMEHPAAPVSTPEELVQSSANLSDEEIRDAVRELRRKEADARRQMLKAAPEEKKELRRQIETYMARRKDMETVQKQRQAGNGQKH